MVKPYIGIDTTKIEFFDNGLASKVTLKQLAHGTFAGAFAVVSLTPGSQYYCDGIADNIQIQQALDDCYTAGGGIVHLKVGTYSLSKYISVPDYVTLEGEGDTTLLKLADDSINATVTIPFERGAVIWPGGLSLTDNGGILYQGVYYKTTYGIRLRNFKLDANRVGQTGLIPDDLYGIALQWVNNVKLENLWVINAFSSGIAIWPTQGLGGAKVDTESTITRCRLENNNDPTAWNGHAGIFISNGTVQPTKVIVSDCISMGNRRGYCVEDSAGGVLINNCIGSSNTEYGLTFHTASWVTVNGGFFSENGFDGIAPTGAGQRYETINGVCCYKNGRYGMTVENDWAITGGNIIDNDDAGIFINGAYNYIINGVFICGNGAAIDAIYPYGVYITGGIIYTQGVISGCYIGNDYFVYRTVDSQTYGIYESNACENIYTGNSFATYGSNQIAFNRGSGSTSIIRNNKGWVTENSGTGTIASGATTSVITHGLSVTPTLKDISITLGELSTTDPGQIYITNIGATTFTVNCRTNPGVSGLDFAWQAIVL
ncbi:MAG: right-handed parallel beta-helix repeat-containing protein [Candidatus Humimicrobiaceae bacterium]